MITILCCMMSGLGMPQDVPGGSRPDKSSQPLALRLTETPKPNYGVAIPSQISGRVIINPQAIGKGGIGKGAIGVSVTDGFSVVKTDAGGAYRLKPDPRAVFVYLTRPSGYDVEGHWYKPLAAQVDFALKPAIENENDYVFVHVTDTHVSQDQRSVSGLRRFVREVNTLTPRPRFVVNSGDLLNLHKALLSSAASGHADFRNYAGIINHLEMPCYNVAGDHTDSSYRLKQFPRGHIHCGKPLYWEYLGPHFFSFEYGRIHFVSVDFGYHLGQRQINVNGRSLEYPTLKVQPPHVKWMSQDMAQRTAKTFVVTTAEHDLTKFCPGFLEMAKQHDVRLQLVGDTHVVSYKSRPVPYRSGGALAGCWWNPKANQLCPDLSPQGYLVYRVRGERLEHFYKGLGRRVEIVSHRMGALWRGPVTVRAHLVQPGPNEKLEYTVNGRDWQAMREIGRPFYRTVYAATVDSASLPDGRLRLKVRSTASGEVRFGTFVAANGNDEARFTRDARLDFQVGAANSWITPRAPAAKVDVLFNGKVVGTLEPMRRKAYSFAIPASLLRSANMLSFRFAAGDGITLGRLRLAWRGNDVRDVRDEAIRQVKVAHWGSQAADWGGYLVGDSDPPDESPFDRKQNVFCFLLPR